MGTPINKRTENPDNHGLMIAQNARVIVEFLEREAARAKIEAAFDRGDRSYGIGC